MTYRVYTEHMSVEERTLFDKSLDEADEDSMSSRKAYFDQVLKRTK